MTKDMVEAILEQGRLEERAKIVAWLRQQWNEDEDWGEWFAERIEDGAHLI
jgi:hypothetical protein